VGDLRPVGEALAGALAAAASAPVLSSASPWDSPPPRPRPPEWDPSVLADFLGGRAACPPQADPLAAIGPGGTAGAVEAGAFPGPAAAGEPRSAFVITPANAEAVLGAWDVMAQYSQRLL
jgi:hypothetical protein